MCSPRAQQRKRTATSLDCPLWKVAEKNPNAIATLEGCELPVGEVRSLLIAHAGSEWLLQDN